MSPAVVATPLATSTFQFGCWANAVAAHRRTKLPARVVRIHRSLAKQFIKHLNMCERCTADARADAAKRGRVRDQVTKRRLCFRDEPLVQGPVEAGPDQSRNVLFSCGGRGIAA